MAGPSDFAVGADRSYADVWVVSGPLFLPSTDGGRKTVSYQLIGRNDVAVPSHLFKVVYAEDGASGRRRTMP